MPVFMLRQGKGNVNRKGEFKMPYRICPHCGANLDPEEKCNCQEEEDEDRSYQGTFYNERGTGIVLLGSCFGESVTG